MKRCFALLCAFAALVCAGCPKTKPPIQTLGIEANRSGFILNTVCNVTLFNAGSEVFSSVFHHLVEIENHLSLYQQDSDISHVNDSAGIAPVEVNDDTFKVVERALHFAEISGGAFDPTVGPLISLWDIGRHSRILSQWEDNIEQLSQLQTAHPIPSQAQIEAVLPLINWKNVDLDRDRRTIFLRQPGMALDLGALGKGYAADEAVKAAREAGVKHALVNLGGDLLISGERPDGTDWRVGVREPSQGSGVNMGILNVGECAIATSGVYERYFTDGETLYHHLLSPFDGYPVQNGLVSVTVITGNAMDADALSTVVFVLGYEKGRALVESLGGTEAVFIFSDRNIRKTSGANFDLVNEAYTLVD